MKTDLIALTHHYVSGQFGGEKNQNMAETMTHRSDYIPKKKKGGGGIGSEAHNFPHEKQRSQTLN